MPRSRSRSRSRSPDRSKTLKLTIKDEDLQAYYEYMRTDEQRDKDYELITLSDAGYTAKEAKKWLLKFNHKHFDSRLSYKRFLKYFQLFHNHSNGLVSTLQEFEKEYVENLDEWKERKTRFPSPYYNKFLRNVSFEQWVKDHYAELAATE